MERRKPYSSQQSNSTFQPQSMRRSSLEQVNPGRSEMHSSSTPINAGDSTRERAMHTVKAGDTPWKIAENKQGSGNRWQELQKKNGGGFTKQEARRLSIGTSVDTPEAESHSARSIGSKHSLAARRQLQANTSQANQPLVGIIDRGFGKGEHGTEVLETISSVNNRASTWLGQGVGNGGWAESLTEFVDTAKASGQKRAVANLSFDLTEKHPDGSVTTRSQLTAEEQQALTYARDKGVLIVASAGNQGGAMSALGQASQQFDNIIAVGAADGKDRASYSSYGNGLDLLAPGSQQGDAFTGTSRSAAEVTGAISQMWAANPTLDYRQVTRALESTATDLQQSGWDTQTGAGLLNTAAAVNLARTITPKTQVFSGAQLIQQVNGSFDNSTWKSTNGAVASERLAWSLSDIGHAALDVIGTIDPTPISDGLNAVWYAAEGDYTNAAISAASMIPYVGDTAKAAKWGAKGVKAAKDAEKGAQGIKEAGKKADTAHISGNGGTATEKSAQSIKEAGKKADTAHISGNGGTATLTKPSKTKQEGSSKTYETTDKTANSGAKPKESSGTKPPDLNKSKGLDDSKNLNKSKGLDDSKNLNKSKGLDDSKNLNKSKGLDDSKNSNKSKGLDDSKNSNKFKGLDDSKNSNKFKGLDDSKNSNKSKGLDDSKNSNKSKGLDDSKNSNKPKGLDDSKDSNKPKDLDDSKGSTKNGEADARSQASSSHQIRQGDTLWEIAEDNLGSGTRWRELRKPDGSSFTEQEARHLQPGESVLVPKEKSGEAKPPTQSPWNPRPPEEIDPLFPHIHDTGDLKYAQDPLIVSRLDEIRQGESLSEFAKRIGSGVRVFDEKGNDQSRLPNSGSDGRITIEDLKEKHGLTTPQRDLIKEGNVNLQSVDYLLSQGLPPDDMALLASLYKSDGVELTKGLLEHGRPMQEVINLVEQSKNSKKNLEVVAKRFTEYSGEQKDFQIKGKPDPKVLHEIAQAVDLGRRRGGTFTFDAKGAKGIDGYHQSPDPNEPRTPVSFKVFNKEKNEKDPEARAKSVLNDVNDNAGKVKDVIKDGEKAELFAHTNLSKAELEDFLPKATSPAERSYVDTFDRVTLICKDGEVFELPGN